MADISGRAILKFNKQASRRTKNRIREHGPEFLVVREGHLKSLGSSILVMSVAERSSDGRGGKESWFGWLPFEEIDIKYIGLTKSA
jgi:hypothetical protein